MYQKYISPIISERDFRILKTIYGKHSQVDSKDYAKQFISVIHRYFPMKYVSKVIGQSVRHCYRILNGYQTNPKITLLIINLSMTNDYEIFKLMCENDNIMVRG